MWEFILNFLSVITDYFLPIGLVVIYWLIRHLTLCEDYRFRSHSVVSNANDRYFELKSKNKNFKVLAFEKLFDIALQQNVPFFLKIRMFFSYLIFTFPIEVIIESYRFKKHSNLRMYDFFLYFSIFILELSKFILAEIPTIGFIYISFVYKALIVISIITFLVSLYFPSERKDLLKKYISLLSGGVIIFGLGFFALKDPLISDPQLLSQFYIGLLKLSPFLLIGQLIQFLFSKVFLLKKIDPESVSGAVLNRNNKI